VSSIPREALEQVNDPDWEISPWVTRERLRAEPERWALVDCRRPDEFEVAKVEGALLVPLQDMASRLPELEAFAERTVVIMCHTGRRSLKAAAFLRENGFERVLSMCGGIQRWSEEVDPSVPQY